MARPPTMKVSTNAPEVKTWARWIYKDQIPFASSKAINETAKDFQKAQRQHMSRIFTIRRPWFVLRAVKIKPWAHKRRLWAEVSIDPPGGQKRADILTKFETQRWKTPFRGNVLAVPTDEVPTTGAGIIRKPYRPKQLFRAAAQHGRGRAIGTKGNVWKGKKRTVLIRKPGGRGWIFQRQPAEGLTLLYTLVPRVRITPELHFHRIARRTVDANYPRHFAREFNKAIRTARR